MPRTRFALLLAALVGALGLLEGAGDRLAFAETKTKVKAKAKAKGSVAKKAGKESSRRGVNKKGKKAKRFSGQGVDPSQLRTEPLPRPSGDVWVYAENLREEVRVNIYDENGNFDEAALATLDAAFRCKRSGEVRAVNPRLYEVLSMVYDQFGKQRIDLVSGFRLQPNEGSRHFHASAMDIYVPGVDLRQLYEFAESLDAGGMGIGIYPRAGFVHVDLRAPGEPSYRWTDYSPPDGAKRRGKKSKRKPTS